MESWKISFIGIVTFRDWLEFSWSDVCKTFYLPRCHYPFLLVPGLRRHLEHGNGVCCLTQAVCRVLNWGQRAELLSRQGRPAVWLGGSPSLKACRVAITGGLTRDGGVEWLVLGCNWKVLRDRIVEVRMVHPILYWKISCRCILRKVQNQWHRWIRAKGEEAIFNMRYHFYRDAILYCTCPWRCPRLAHI